ncbi:MAG: MBL fold metallo-hydrolase [Gordonibacter pamelaeae]
MEAAWIERTRERQPLRTWPRPRRGRRLPGSALRHAGGGAADLYLVRVPLPHNPLRALNSYLILSKDRTTIVDVGFNHPACEEALDQALAALGRTWDGVEIVLTHSHPDHTGNLDRIYRDGMPFSRTSTRSKRWRTCRTWRRACSAPCC